MTDWQQETRSLNFFYRPFGEILYSLQTGHPARSKVLGMDGWMGILATEYRGGRHLRRRDDRFRVDGGAGFRHCLRFLPMGQHKWDSIMDVGGGNGVLLAAILEAYPDLRGVLADRPHVLERARERGFLGGKLQARSSIRIVSSSVKYLWGVALT